MSCHSPDRVEPPAMPGRTAMTPPDQSDDLAPAAVEARGRDRAADHGCIEQDCHDREPDEEQDDVGDQRRPEDVGVADARVIEVIGAQPEQPSRDDEQHDDRRDDAEDDDPAPELAWGPDDPGAGAPPSENLLWIEAEGTHEVTECSCGPSARSLGFSGVAAAASRRMGRGGAGPCVKPRDGSAPCTAPADAGPPRSRRR